MQNLTVGSCSVQSFEGTDLAFVPDPITPKLSNEEHRAPGAQGAVGPLS